MQPNQQLITITDNLKKIELLLDELVLRPRLNAIKWSAITRQTPNIKVGYPGQHLASLITGMEGERTGARGNDLRDGSEVKSCSRIDQLDKCRACGSAVARLEVACPQCNSLRIIRNNDSKWLFTIRSEDELRLLTQTVPRILLILGDYPDFDAGDFNKLRFQCYEIWTNDSRHRKFAEIMSNYFHLIYSEHKKQNPNKSPAPKNFWPYQYQFYMCNPILTFSCIVENANVNPNVSMKHYIEPGEDRAHYEAVVMPQTILDDEEINLIKENAPLEDLNKVFRGEAVSQEELARMSISQVRVKLVGVTESLRRYLPLRDTGRIATAATPYARRGTT